MKALLYKVSICSSSLDYSHGNFTEILEIYIPEVVVSFNIGFCETLNCFYTASSRYEKATLIKELEISDSIVRDLLTIINTRTDICNRVKSMLYISEEEIEQGVICQKKLKKKKVHTK